MHRKARRGIASGERGGSQMSHPLKALGGAAREYFAAPDALVIAVACAVKTHSQDLALEVAVLREHGCHMGPVVLHGDLPSRSHLLRVLAGSVLRVRVIRHGEVVPANAIH